MNENNGKEVIKIKAQLPWLNIRFLKLVRFFSHNDHTSERKFFGLGQFVLLLTLAPFIFNLSLYSFGESKEVAAHYEYKPDRFDQLPALTSEKNVKFKPVAPRLQALPRHESKELTTCKKYPLHQFFYVKNCNHLRNKAKIYAAAYFKKQLTYIKKLTVYSADRKQYKKELDSKYRAFNPNQVKPEPLPTDIEVKQFSKDSFNAMLSDSLSGNDWQKVTFPIWLLGALLIIPTILLCLRRQRWGLLTFGLLVPAFNYIVTIPPVFLDWEALSGKEITSTLIPQAAFIWFALKGKIRSKSFAYFILLLVICTFIPNLVGDETGFSTMRAQLPILVFIVACLIARLLVRIVQENAYLFHNLGWSKSLRTGLHSLVLWLPMVLLAMPYFYITEVVLPKHAVNHLNQKGVLQFNHEHDILDNALQSTAAHSDDAIYAWHIITQSMKKDIYFKSEQLQDVDLQLSIERAFDKVMPKSLAFDPYDSDAFLVAPVVELSVDASQASTNKAFKNLRGKLRKQLGNLAAGHDTQFQNAIDQGKDKAWYVIEDLHQQGQDAILETNRSTQDSAWWTISYLRAAHQLTILFFIFICIKSFMYVFARVSFNRDTGSFITLGNTKDSNTKGAVQDNVKSKIKRAGLQYFIHGDAEETFYISRRFQCRGKAPKFTIPQPFHAPMARLFNGAISMNKVVMQQGDDTVSCTAAQGIEFFEWDLRNGEAVIFDFHNFVGMSAKVKISTLISTRISSLLLGKMIYSQATGPGKLILMAKGRAEIIDSENNGGSLPPERLIAMQTNTRLHIDSELDIVNIYLSTAYVRPAGGGQVIVDVDSQRGTKTGLGSFLKRFILPI
ncbi:MAG: hypothetical protein V3U89_01205 [Methylophilaceae bacterium]